MLEPAVVVGGSVCEAEALSAVVEGSVCEAEELSVVEEEDATVVLPAFELDCV